MKSFTLFTSALAAFASTVSAAGVTGAAEGFAKGVTGGGSAAPVYPSTTAELVSYLGDSSPRVIILTKTFDFRNTEGTTSAKGCSPWVCDTDKTSPQAIQISVQALRTHIRDVCGGGYRSCQNNDTNFQ